MIPVGPTLVIVQFLKKQQVELAKAIGELYEKVANCVKDQNLRTVLNYFANATRPTENNSSEAFSKTHRPFKGHRRENI